ncbi:MAG: right-handed parallel beta-helix repeat-containing protein, partial [Bacteroidales bacterium]
NLFFHETSAYQPGEYDTDGWDVWQMGAIYIDKSSEHCIIRNNDIFDCVAGIKSYGKHALIENNYIHDCNRVLKEWHWGPIGIWLGADHQEVRYNRIINYRAEDDRIVWNGADGSAMEIDDGRYHKSNISIHHNYTRACQGFLEVTGSDVGIKPRYENFRIHHNISDDYQWFVGLWRSKGFRIDHNTVIRTRVNSNEKGVFHITTRDAKNFIRNNIIVTRDSIVVFNTGQNRDNRPGNLIQNNLYFATDGRLNMGKEGPGENPVFGDPRFRNYSNRSSEGDYAIMKRSKGIDKALKLEASSSSEPCGAGSDIGAVEFSSKRKSKKVKNQ